jgi:hypothetical protein
MQRFIVLTLGLVMAAGMAEAQIGVPVDCDTPPGCERTKYGLDGANLLTVNNTLPKFTNVAADNDVFFLDESFFGPNIGGSSYTVTTQALSSVDAECGNNRNVNAIPGQMVLDERADCTPVSFGPDDAANGGVAGGCRVSIPLNDGGKGTIDAVGTNGTCQEEGGPCTSDADCQLVNSVDICQWDLENTSVLLIPTIAQGVIAGSSFFLGVATENTIGGASIPALHDEQCDPDIVRTLPTSGTRYLLPDTHAHFEELNADGEAPTYVRWDNDPETRWRIHTDDTGICCISAPGDICGLIAVNTPEYPALLKRTCSDGQWVQDSNETNDWIFDDGRGSAFYSDTEYIPTGQQQGACEMNRSVSCLAGGNECQQTYCEAGFDLIVAAPCGSAADCAIFGDLGLSDACVAPDGDPETEGIQPDSCDLREKGHRVRPVPLSDGGVNTERCATSLYVLRGTPGQGCSINPRYTVNGDPGPTCEILNFGVATRKDQDCDGAIDNPVDWCPFLTEWDERADADGDCPGPDCRADECECGDNNLDGFVDVNDILSINGAIFDVNPERNLCDTTGDTDCNVSDILGTNSEVFVPGSSTCRHVQPLPPLP